ncbi:hypothetical protein CLIB1423_01S07140 [[Candida] railenensis]|uniref:Uncharacterized protein n=1 Tax=[Candida] railenensis TaxID=45579 RepID=A0A9P0VWB4_9ASCO|nr:hypothetical protein CLIB1423_01S07140 [[Candida] railenensis]
MLEHCISYCSHCSHCSSVLLFYCSCCSTVHIVLSSTSFFCSYCSTVHFVLLFYCSTVLLFSCSAGYLGHPLSPFPLLSAYFIFYTSLLHATSPHPSISSIQAIIYLFVLFSLFLSF